MPLTHVETSDLRLIPRRVNLYDYWAVVRDVLLNEALAAGTNFLALPAVASGYLSVYTSIVLYYSGTVTNVTLQAEIVSGAASYGLFKVTGITSGSWYDRQGVWVLAAGDYLRLAIVNATLNDDGRITATGHTVKLT